MKLNTKTLMLEKLEGEKQSIQDENKDKFKEIREEFRVHIEHISMQLEDYRIMCKLNSIYI